MHQSNVITELNKKLQHLETVKAVLEKATGEIASLEEMLRLANEEPAHKLRLKDGKSAELAEKVRRYEAELIIPDGIDEATHKEISVIYNEGSYSKPPRSEVLLALTDCFKRGRRRPKIQCRIVRA
jgi:predicted nuclease with TOPRIM domain